MRTSAITNSIETRESNYFTHFKNSKRVQWASFRNYK